MVQMIASTRQSRPELMVCPSIYAKTATGAFEALCRDTAEIYESGYDLACLRLLFNGCSKLREVTIASHAGRESDRRLNAEFTAFASEMTVLYEDWTRVYAGVH
jgi:hypothetical protein